jgi:fatty-acyl-CoA synthase
MQIMDRRRDVIKSGGEWISSIDLENAAVAHDDVTEAAVIAISDLRWAERPLPIVTPRPDHRSQRDDLLAFLALRFPRWMLPDDVVVLAELPYTVTGKVMKTRLREMFREHKPPGR